MQGNGDWWSAPGEAARHAGAAAPPNGMPGYRPGHPGYQPNPGYPPNAPGYYPNGGYAMPPGQQLPMRPPYGVPPRRSSGNGWILGLLGAIVAVVLLVVAAVVFVDNSGTSPDEMAEVFPALVEPDGSTGYDDQSCWHESDGKVRAPKNDALRLGNWTDAWDCWGHVGKPTYVVLAYPEQSDASKAIDQLPPNKKSFLTYNAYSWQTPDTANPVQFWKAHAFTDSRRSRFIVLAQEQYWPTLAQGKNLHDFDRWCVAMFN
ncbi:hypothetical protein ACFVAV_04230 [Nocardia sp. NPDC057663]|uniref:hypothetical protein n=1 Tax=Nocardia sp. NPDC057663 TaxID=3346201 RepID=UPI003671CD21